MVAKFFLPNSARPNRAGGEGARGGMQVDQESFPSSQLYMELRALFASTPPQPPTFCLQSTTPCDCLAPLLALTADRHPHTHPPPSPSLLLLTVLTNLETQASTLTVAE
jgi:hypothetical protein